LRRLRAFYREYPREAVGKAVATALEYGLFDLERLEQLILRTIAKDYFVLPGGADTDDDDE
jgi:formaldehyde-activating enzyme involved in methanogenesis